MKRLAGIGLAVLAGVFAAGLYASPYWAAHQLHKAFVSQDAEGVNARIDFPALREDMKGQIAARLMAESAKTGSGGEAIGSMIGMTLVNAAIDSMFTPAALAEQMRSGAVVPQTGAVMSPAQMGKALQDVEFITGYQGFDAFHASPKGREDSSTFVFRRHGLFTWKLSGLTLPRS